MGHVCDACPMAFARFGSFRGLALLAIVTGGLTATIADGEGATSRHLGHGAVRRCATSVLPVGPTTVSSAARWRHGPLVFIGLEDNGLPYQAVGPSGNHDGRYYISKWSVGVVGHDPVRITSFEPRARFAFRTGAVDARRSDTDLSVDFHPCPQRHLTAFVGGVMLLDHPRCVRMLITDLHTRRRWWARFGVARSCPA